MSGVTVKLSSDPQSDPHSGDFPPCGPGDVIHGKYRIERLVGSGGMAWVFEATHLVLQHPVALKVLRMDTGADNTEALERFRREARAAAAVPGEATARVMDTGTFDDGSPFLVMELLEGHDLDSVIQAGPYLPIATAANLVLQACEGVAETHAVGIVHRDLKPSNLFITHTSDGSVRVKLLDFGISKITGPSGDARVTATRSLIGSPVYMSPEQMRSSRHIDVRTDIWSLGVILYELLAGCSPFEAPTLPAVCAHVLDSPPPSLRNIRRDVPRALEAVVLRCLQKDPNSRFQTVADFAEALARFGPADAHARARRVRRILTAIGPSMPRVRSRPPSRWPVAGALAAAALLILGGILLQHPSYVESTMLAGRAWTRWTFDLAKGAAAAARQMPTTSSALPPPEVASSAPLPREVLSPEVVALPEPLPEAPRVVASGGPSASEQKMAPRRGTSLSGTAEASDAASPATIAALLAQARGEPLPGAPAVKSTRVRALHRLPGSHAGKRYVIEPTPSPEPAPPIVVSPPAAPSLSRPALRSADDPNPYDDAVPDVGGRD
jgi:eukaryotic-like serine/threonine-protein kinase